jgi:hypothetical protein
MSAAHPRFRLALLIAIFAVCAQALLPTLMRGQQSVDPAAMTEICTVFGIQIQSQQQPEAGGQPSAEPGHCPWCMAQSAHALPLLSFDAVFARHAESERPPARLTPDFPSYPPLVAPPRAPPRLA